MGPLNLWPRLLGNGKTIFRTSNLQIIRTLIAHYSRFNSKSDRKCTGNESILRCYYVVQQRFGFVRVSDLLRAVGQLSVPALMDG